MQSKEALLRKWYNLEVDTGELQQETSNPNGDILLQSDSEECPELLLQTDSSEGARDTDDDMAQDIQIDENDLDLQTSSGEDKAVPPPPAKKRRYNARSSDTMKLKFLQKPVCRAAHMRLYGIGSSAVQNVRSGRQAYNMNETRMKEPKHPTLGVSLARSNHSTKWPNILSFFWMLYISVAEIMPTKFVMPSCGQPESFVDQDPDFQERYTRAFMSSIEKNFDLSPAP